MRRKNRTVPFFGPFLKNKLLIWEKIITLEVRVAMSNKIFGLIKKRYILI